MTTQIATTIEQSQRLIACGVDKDTADFYWCDFIPDEPFLAMGEIPRNNDTGEVMSDGDVPAWSLSALLALLPKEITDDNGDSYYLSIAQEFPLTNEYGVSYKPCWFEGDALIRTRDNCPIEACVKAVEWLTQNGYTLNKP